MLAPAGPARARQALPDCNPQQRPLPVGIIRAYTAHVHAADRGGSPGECRAFVPTRLYHPALAGTPPEEGNWNYLINHLPVRWPGGRHGFWRRFPVPRGNSDSTRVSLIFYVCGLRKIAMTTLTIELPDSIAREAGLLAPRTLAPLFEDAVRRSRQIKTDNARRLKIMIPGSRINPEHFTMPGRGVTR